MIKKTILLPTLAFGLLLSINSTVQAFDLYQETDNNTQTTELAKPSANTSHVSKKAHKKKLGQRKTKKSRESKQTNKSSKAQSAEQTTPTATDSAAPLPPTQ